MLAACAAPSSQDVQIGLRNPTVPLGGTTRFDADRFAGQWHTVACLGQCVDRVLYQVAGDGMILRRAAGREVVYTPTAPGVLREKDGSGTLAGVRTAAIGDADGGWAAILDRRRPGGADRIKAAREILDFNGWNTSKLREMNG